MCVCACGCVRYRFCLSKDVDHNHVRILVVCVCVCVGQYTLCESGLNSPSMDKQSLYFMSSAYVCVCVCEGSVSARRWAPCIIMFWPAHRIDRHARTCVCVLHLGVYYSRKDRTCNTFVMDYFIISIH